MKQVAKEKYFGDQLSYNGLVASITETIAKMKGIVVQKIFDSKAVIDDCPSHVTGGVMTGLDIWEMAVIPFLLNNCNTWLGINNTAIEELEKLQQNYQLFILHLKCNLK